MISFLVQGIDAYSRLNFSEKAELQISNTILKIVQKQAFQVFCFLFSTHYGM